MTAPALFIDTFSLFFRAHHALPPMSTKAGEPTSALYGFSALLLKLLREQRGAAIAFALDAPQATFRHETFGAYKAGRAATPATLAAQFGRLQQLLSAFGVPQFCCPGFEADDVLATLAQRARDAGRSALVVSGDRDMLQLARGSVKVHFLGRRGKEALVYDAPLVLARFGVEARFLPSLVALIGDPSDNLPGVPGVGTATASRLLRGKANCLELLDGLGDVKSERMRETLRTYREQILGTEALARLREDAPIGDAAAPWGVPTAAALLAVGEVFKELEFQSLLNRLSALSS